MILTERALCTGACGVQLETPPGDVIAADDESGLTIHDVENELQWSITFFENLHMDLRSSTKEHLESAIER